MVLDVANEALMVHDFHPHSVIARWDPGNCCLPQVV